MFYHIFIFRNNQKIIENQTHSPKMTFRRTKASEDGTQGGFTQVTRRSCHQPNFQTGKSEEGSSAYRMISLKFQIQSILILSVGSFEVILESTWVIINRFIVKSVITGSFWQLS